MALTFLNARKELAAQLGLDYTNTDTKTLLNRWLNLSYQDIIGEYDWSWLQDRETVTTETDFTTGTVSATAAGTTITFSAGPTASQANRFIQFSSADDWYEITAHTAGATTATIDPAYAQTTNLTAGTFTIRTFYYSLSSSAEYVYSCKQAISTTYIPIIPVNRYERVANFPDATGDPEYIYMWGQDSSGNWQFSPFPWPDAPILLEFKTIKKASDLTSDSETPAFPARFDSIWLYGAKCYGYDFLDDDRSDKSFNRFYARLGNMRKRDNVGLTKHYVLQPVDGRITSGGARFPAEFGDIR